MEQLQMLIGLSIPMVFAGIFHMVVVKFDWLSSLRIPISTGHFGKNKTWRGFVVMPMFGILGVYLGYLYSPDLFMGQSLLLLGAIQGFFYALFELPNSWWKRRKKIEPGKLPTRGKFIHAIVDQADSVVGCSLVYYYFLKSFGAIHFFVMVLFRTGVHLIFNFLLFVIKVRKEPL